MYPVEKSRFSLTSSDFLFLEIRVGNIEITVREILHIITDYKN